MLRAYRRQAVLVASTTAVLLVASPAPGITHTWSGGFAFDPDGMNTSSNWSGGTPVSGSSNLTLIFPSGAVSNPDQDIAPVLVLQSMQLTSGMGYTMHGNAYQFTNLGAAPTLSTSGFVNFLSPVSFVNATTHTLTGSAAFGGPLSGGANLTINGGSGSNFTIQGGGSNSHTGTVFANAVTLNLNKGGTAIAGDLHANTATIFANNPNQFGANSDVVLNNNSSLNINASQTLRDIRLDNGSTVNMTTGPVLTITGNISSLSGSGVLGNTFAANINLGGGIRTIDVQTTGPSDVLSIFSQLSNGRFIKTGPGVVSMFNNGNTFTGQNVVSAGTLRGNADSIGSDVLNNATVELSGGTLASPIISGTGQVVIPGFVNFNAPQSYAGGTDVRFGGQVFGTAATLLGNFTSTTGGGTVNFNQSTNGTFSGSLSGAIHVQKLLPGTLTVGGTNSHTLGTSLNEGGLRITSDAALGAGPLNFQNFGFPLSIEAVGSRTLPNMLNLGASFSVVGAGDFNFTDATTKAIGSVLTHNSTGSTTLAGKFNAAAGSSIVVNSGSLTLGDPAAVGGFTSAGSVIVNGGTLTVRSLNFTTLPDVTLAGGTLNATNGYAIPLGAALQGNGGVTGRVASANGSTILANGNLTVGDGAHVAGVNLDGELYTKQFNVTLADANQAVLGSLTTIGNGPGSPGTLTAANGLVLNFGRNLTGFGNVNSSNTLADAVIANGDVQGDSLLEPLTFSGFVKGVGTFNNVTFGGTFAPGLSPALVTVGSISFAPSNVLEIEVGGLNRGSQFDAIDATGGIGFNGTLKVMLINGFNPSLGDVFDIFNGPTVGAFSAYNFPALGSGLSWDTSDLYTLGELQIVPEPSSMLLAACGLALLARRR